MNEDPDSKSSFANLKNEWKLLWDSLKFEETHHTPTSHTPLLPPLNFDFLPSHSLHFTNLNPASLEANEGLQGFLARPQLERLSQDLSQKRQKTHQRLEEIARHLDQPDLEPQRRDELHEEGIRLNEELFALHSQIRQVMKLTHEIGNAV